MALITKEQYARRNENASKRMIENSKNDLLTKEQHEAIALLCRARHELHSNQAHAITEDYRGLKQAIVTANIAICENKLAPMSFCPVDSSDYIDIDSLCEIEYEEDEYDSEYERISSELENLNSRIENYLRQIDAMYNTNYAPTGALRIF